MRRTARARRLCKARRVGRRLNEGNVVKGKVLIHFGCHALGEVSNLCVDVLQPRGRGPSAKVLDGGIRVVLQLESHCSTSTERVRAK